MQCHINLQVLQGCCVKNVDSNGFVVVLLPSVVKGS